MIFALSLPLLLTASTIESPDRDTLFGLDPPVAAAVGAAIGGGGCVIIALAGAALTTVSPAFVLLPLIATLGLPVASAFGAIFASSLSDNALSVAFGAGGGAFAGGLVGATSGLIIGALVDENAALPAAWIGGMVVGAAGGAGAAYLWTSFNE